MIKVFTVQNRNDPHAEPMDNVPVEQLLQVVQDPVLGITSRARHALAALSRYDRFQIGVRKQQRLAAMKDEPHWGPTGGWLVRCQPRKKPLEIIDLHTLGQTELVIFVAVCAAQIVQLG